MGSFREMPVPSRFRVLSRLGRGAQGAVYEAIDLTSNVRVALKTITITRPEQIVRFKSEFRAIRDLRHPNLVKLGELAEENGHWFFTMEIVDGVDFIAWIRGAQAPRSADASTLPTAVTAKPTVDADTRVEASRVATAEATAVTAPAASAETVAEPIVSRTPLFDEARLRAGLGSLIGALAAIHRAGKVHRDLKPSNVLVAANGRLVLIDFGVVAELGDQTSDDGLVIGTSAYMAPEQARAETIGPAADWYALGALLFEALTGRPPFIGKASDIIRAKCSVEAPSPSVYVDGVPADLDALCRRLLARDPAARPSDDELAAAFGDPEAAAAPAHAAFVGRAAEQAQLEAAFDDTRAGRARVVVIEGPSGVGKSELVARFVTELGRRQPKLLLLRSRCHEQERLPYNALDGIVDGLARFLATRRPGKLQAYLPTGIEQLARLFPVLEIVAPIEEAVYAARERQAPPERAAAFAALTELLARLASRRPVVLVVDDVQWADADSLTLLTELLRPPSAPPLFFIATARPASDGAPLAALAAVTSIGADATHLPLGGLAGDDAATLLERLLAQHGAPPDLDRAAILAEAEGHPLFLAELVRHLAHAPAATGARTLNDVISARVSVLPLAARTLLSVVAVAGVPVAQSVAARVAELEPAEYLTQLETLRAGQLVRVAGVRLEDTIEPYHDRVRETVYERLHAGERVRLHRKLGLLLEEAGAGADLLFGHFEKAGERVAAARHAETAAAAAARALAFDRAAELYDHALVLGRHSDADRGRLLAALGDALTNAGRPREAAAAFLDSATTPGRSRDELLELHRRAAEQLLMGGHLEAGLDATRALLAALALPFPEGTAGALAKLAWRQARLTLRPLRWPKRPADALPADTRRLLDVYWSVSAGLGLVDSVRGMLFALGGALASLDYGDEARIARALSTAAIAEAGLGSRRRATRLADAAARAADSDGSDRARFYGAMARQGCAFLIDNDWRRVLQLGDEAARLWRASGHVAAGFEWDASEQFNCWALDNLGRLRDVCERVPLRIRSAQRAGNRFMEVAFRSFFANVHLTVDDAAEARRDVRDAIAAWLPGRDDFGNQHYLALRSLTYIALYDGSVDAVAAELTPKWQRFYGSLMRHVLLLRQDGRMLTAQLALARAVAAQQRGDATAATALARTARHDAAALARVRLPMAQAALPRVLAGIAALAGDDAAAVAQLRTALARAEATGAALHAAAVRRRLGALVGGSEGAALVVAGDAFMAAQGVRNPARMTAALVPG